jgi:hypothetical protein
MKSQHRFLQVRNGVTYFAHVEVEATELGTTSAIEDHLPDHPNAAEGEANKQTAPHWVKAAMQGMQEAVQFARDHGVTVPAWRLALTKLLGTPVDTREDVVRCAAYLATLSALGHQDALPCGKVVFGNGQWTVQFPSLTASSVQGTSQ